MCPHSGYDLQRRRCGPECRWPTVSWPRCEIDGGPSGATVLQRFLPRRDRDRAVQRRQGSRMRNYEMMIILDPTLEERTVQPSLEQFLQIVPTGGGKVEKLDIWGRRRLAYDIDKRAEGIYAVVDLAAEPDTVRELDRQLNLNEAVLRTKVVRPQIH